MYAWKLVSAPQSHKIEYVPMHTIRDNARLATMLAGLIAPRIRLGFVWTMPHLRLDYALASISCEHCRSLRNHPHCVPRHMIYYYSTVVLHCKKWNCWKLPTSWQSRFGSLWNSHVGENSLQCYMLFYPSNVKRSHLLEVIKRPSRHVVI